MPLAGAGFGANLISEIVAEGIANPIGATVNNVFKPEAGLEQAASGDKVFLTPLNSAIIRGRAQGVYNTEQILRSLGIPVDLTPDFNTPAEAAAYDANLSADNVEQNNRSYLMREIQAKLADYLGQANVLGIGKQYDTIINRDNLAAAMGLKALDTSANIAMQAGVNEANSFGAAADYAKGVAAALVSPALSATTRY